MSYTRFKSALKKEPEATAQDIAKKLDVGVNQALAWFGRHEAEARQVK
jgi:predicted ArsR family transcriptional regulator